METTHFSHIVVLKPEDNKQLLNLCGRCDEHLSQIEKKFNVQINHRGYQFSISGDSAEAIKHAEKAIVELYIEAKKPLLTSKQVHLYLQTMNQSEKQDKVMEVRIKRNSIMARGESQIKYLQNILQNDISFGIGPAGTGKTYLAVACAVNALETERVARIILVRPIVEAGERLGFLPGDLAQKVHPYLRPLYDALYEMFGFELVGQLIEKDIIELVPLAYMRGRSLNDSFIILDEAQNTTAEQMKMFLTRLGFNSKAVITGDITQIDLANHRDSGLIHAMNILKNVKGIGFSQFLSSDVVRHPLVQSIVEAYEEYNNKDNK